LLLFVVRLPNPPEDPAGFVVARVDPVEVLRGRQRLDDDPSVVLVDEDLS
jgi:hypothetical protein